MVTVRDCDGAKRVSSIHKIPIAPVKMNGHSDKIGKEPNHEQYEYGIQIINGDKEFKYFPPGFDIFEALTNTFTVLISVNTSMSPKQLKLDSIII